jgi:hypothetical protein
MEEKTEAPEKKPLLSLEEIRKDPRLNKGFRAFRQFQRDLGRAILYANKGIEEKQ